MSDISEETDIDEELGYLSPLEHVDPYISFKQALTGTLLTFTLVLTSSLTLSPAAFQMKNAPLYQLATTSLSTEQQTLLMEVMRVAEENSAKAQSSQ